jgi:hypothetical protein
MLVLDALFAHFRQISSNVEIIGPVLAHSASERPSWVATSAHFRLRSALHSAKGHKNEAVRCAPIL